MANVTIHGICNAALYSIGHARSISYIYDGSEMSNVAVAHWAQVRDVLLYTMKPIWAHRDAPLTLLKSAPNINNGFADYSSAPWTPAYPNLPWLYEYTWPSDCLHPLQIKVSPTLVPIWRPRHKTFRPIFDSVSSEHTILTNQPGAILNYVAQILDPNDWYTDFVEMMIMAMAKRFEADFGKRQSPPQQQEQQQPQQGQQQGG